MESFLVGNPVLAYPERRPLKSNCNDVQELFGNADKWRPPEAKTCITSRVGQWFYTHLSLPLNIANASLLENTQVKK